MKYIHKYLNLLIAFIQHRWAIVKRPDYKKVWQVLVGVMEILPGLIAWVIEVAALAASVICIVQATRLGVELRFYAALILTALSAMLIALALLSDYYTRPRQPKQGGGS